MSKPLILFPSMIVFSFFVAAIGAGEVVSLSLTYNSNIAPLAAVAPISLLSGSPVIDVRLPSNGSFAWLVPTELWAPTAAKLGWELPRNAVSVFPGATTVTTVRLLGGWGASESPSNVAWSDVVFREQNGTLVMRWEVVFDRLDRVLTSGSVTPIIVLDNVPWALAEPSPPGTPQAKYGSNMPPANFPEYTAFIGELARGIGAKYGIENATAWLWRIGTEPNTIPNHWNSTAQAWVQMYIAARDGLLSALPNARVGPGNFCALTEACGRDSYVYDIVDGLVAANVTVNYFATSCYGSFTSTEGIKGYDPSAAAAATLALSALRTRSPSFAHVPLFVMEHGMLGNEQGSRSNEPGAFGAAWYTASSAIHGALGISEIFDWDLFDWGMGSGVPHDTVTAVQVNSIIYSASFILRAWARTVNALVATGAAALVSEPGSATPKCGANSTLLPSGYCLSPRSSDAPDAAQLAGMAVFVGSSPPQNTSLPPLSAGHLGPAPINTLLFLISSFSPDRNATFVVNSTVSFVAPTAWGGRANGGNNVHALAALLNAQSSVFDTILAEAVTAGTNAVPPMQVTGLSDMLTAEGLTNMRAESARWLQMQDSLFAPSVASDHGVSVKCDISGACVITAQLTTPSLLALWINPDF